MPTNRRRLSRTRLGAAHVACNPWSDWSAEFLVPDSILGGFHGDMEALEAYWDAYGESITLDWSSWQPGTRPPAWWHFDNGGEYPEDGDQGAYLDRLGLLSPGERDAIEARKGA